MFAHRERRRRRWTTSVGRRRRRPLPTLPDRARHGRGGASARARRRRGPWPADWVVRFLSRPLANAPSTSTVYMYIIILCFAPDDDYHARSLDAPAMQTTVHHASQPRLSLEFGQVDTELDTNGAHRSQTRDDRDVGRHRRTRPSDGPPGLSVRDGLFSSPSISQLNNVSNSSKTARSPPTS